MTAEEFNLRLINFGINVCLAVENVGKNYSSAHAAKQVARSSTSIAAHYAEARSSQSRKEFIHKIHGCLKEARESDTWLRKLRGIMRRPDAFPDLLDECDQIIAILVASLGTARRRGLDPGGIGDSGNR